MNMLEEVLAKVNVTTEELPENILNSYVTLTTLSIEHKYPLPSDEAAARQVAISEVQNNVRSHQSYIEEFSKKEKADKEWQRILEEQADLDEVSGGALPNLVNELTQEPTLEEEQDGYPKPKEADEEGTESTSEG